MWKKEERIFFVRAMENIRPKYIYTHTIRVVTASVYLLAQDSGTAAARDPLRDSDHKRRFTDSAPGWEEPPPMGQTSQPF